MFICKHRVFVYKTLFMITTQQLNSAAWTGQMNKTSCYVSVDDWVGNSWLVNDHVLSILFSLYVNVCDAFNCLVVSLGMSPSGNGQTSARE